MSKLQTPGFNRVDRSQYDDPNRFNGFPLARDRPVEVFCVPLESLPGDNVI
jgi:hypothetical protein